MDVILEFLEEVRPPRPSNVQDIALGNWVDNPVLLTHCVWGCPVVLSASPPHPVPRVLANNRAVLCSRIFAP
jgi:hypothetical protein